MIYGDIIMNVANQCRPYELEKGKTDAMVQKWEQILLDGIQRGKGMTMVPILR